MCIRDSSRRDPHTPGLAAIPEAVTSLIEVGTFEIHPDFDVSIGISRLGCCRERDLHPLIDVNRSRRLNDRYWDKQQQGCQSTTLEVHSHAVLLWNSPNVHRRAGPGRRQYLPRSSRLAAYPNRPRWASSACGSWRL